LHLSETPKLDIKTTSKPKCLPIETMIGLNTRPPGPGRPAPGSTRPRDHRLAISSSWRGLARMFHFPGATIRHIKLTSKSQAPTMIVLPGSAKTPACKVKISDTISRIMITGTRRGVRNGFYFRPTKILCYSGSLN
jgi:hypothetical protein